MDTKDGFYTLRDLADLEGVSYSTIRKKISANPEDYPPRMALRGHPRFHPDEVEKWAYKRRKKAGIATEVAQKAAERSLNITLPTKDAVWLQTAMGALGKHSVLALPPKRRASLALVIFDTLIEAKNLARERYPNLLALSNERLTQELVRFVIQSSWGGKS